MYQRQGDDRPVQMRKKCESERAAVYPNAEYGARKAAVVNISMLEELRQRFHA